MPPGQDLEAANRRSRLPAPLPLLRPAADRPSTSLRRLLLDRWPGRLLLGSIALKLLLFIVESVAGSSVPGTFLGAVARVGLLVSLAYFAWRLVQLMRQRLLWRVRQKLVISYLFIGVVPALLIVAFFLLGGALMFFNVSAYLYKNGVNDIVNEMRVAATAAAEEIERSRGMRAAIDVLDRKVANSQVRYPGLSVALVPRATELGTPVAGGLESRAGSWAHMPPPKTIPTWVSAGGFSGLLAPTLPNDNDTVQLVVRAVGMPTSRDAKWGVVIDVPVDVPVLELIHQATGVETVDVTLQRERGENSRRFAGRTPESNSTSGLRRVETPSGTKWIVDWVVFLDVADWSGGDPDMVSIRIRVAPEDIYERISLAQSRLWRDWSIGQLTVGMLGIIAALFLVIEIAAFVMGLALARSITGSIHALFVGTERLRQGDLSHRIAIRSRDQLGELAESFNAMTANIEDLLVQAAEKKRLEEELRIAREIQMSLLPRDTQQMAGLTVSALCVPAREVGGDYYDFFRLGERKMGFLIADVAGKGTSAALYMAELKGLMLSLSKIHESPRQLLIEVNRILASNLDSRSFITMTYAVMDLSARTFTCARAGHTPLIYLQRAGSGLRAHALAPNGMVVGLQIDGFEQQFEVLLEELTLPIEAGDVFVLFTDGVTEAMNMDFDMFGEDRLCTLVEEHGELTSDGLRERILREVESFVGEADPHDDMTMILLKVDRSAAAGPGPGAS